MGNPDDDDDQLLVLDLIEDPVISAPDPIDILSAAREFLDPMGPRIFSEGIDPVSNPLLYIAGKRLELSFSRWQ